MGKPLSPLYVGGSFKPCWVTFRHPRTPKGIAALDNLSKAAKRRLASQLEEAGGILRDQVFRFEKSNFPNSVRHVQLLIEEYVIVIGGLGDLSTLQRLVAISEVFCCLLKYCGFRTANEVEFIRWVQKNLELGDLATSFRALDLTQWKFVKAKPKDDFHLTAFDEVLAYAKQFDNDLQVLFGLMD